MPRLVRHYTWRHTRQGEADVWIEETTHSVATSEPTPVDGEDRRWVLVTVPEGAPSPNTSLTVSAADTILPDVAVALLPGWLLGFPDNSHVALETTDHRLARIWRVASDNDGK